VILKLFCDPGTIATGIPAYSFIAASSVKFKSLKS